MSNAWDVAKDMADRHAGLFVKLADDGASVTGAFVGEPHAREVHWTGQRFEECAGEGCADCARGVKKTFRVLFNFFVPGQGMKIVEGSTAFFGSVLAAREKYGLDAWTFEVKRVGAAGDRRTKYTVTAAEPVDVKLKASLAAAAKHDLAALGKRSNESDASHAADDDRDTFF